MPYFGIPIRNGLPIGLGSVAGFGIAPFEPYSLFENGEQGAWYDPSDFSTLFDSSAGTTPVTGVEQFVGLMLDKSKGLAITNLPFTGFINNNMDSVSGSGAGPWTIVETAGYGIAYSGANFSIIAGETIRVQFSITFVSGAVSVYIGNTNGQNTNSNKPSFNVSGTYTAYFRADSTGANRNICLETTNCNCAITIISVDRVAGNHAFQTNSLKRPKLAARYNLLTYTEEFASWGNVYAATISSNSVVAPDGTLTADKLVETSATNIHAVGQTVASQIVSYSYSVYAKAAERDWIIVRRSGTGGDEKWSYFDVANGALGNKSSGVTVNIVDAGNGWWRCTIQFTGQNHASANWLVQVSDSDRNNPDATYAGDPTKGAFFWGADLRPADQATGLIGPTYQRVVDAATYDAVGFLPYLQFDGLSWSMGTNSIDFSATDKVTAWAGVRKLSDATAGIVAELSSVVSTNNGSFMLDAPDVTGANSDFAFYSRGTVLRGADSAALLSPISRIMTGIGDISGDVTTLRLNGVQAETNTGDQGSGNYGNYPLFIGARNNASLFFNGWLSSLIVRGAQSTQSQIEATEAWVNSRTGAY
jgi:hypothetical protein